ncbi:MAG: helix-turn-helix transcriptional regulator [Haloarcula sp.]
MGRTVGILVVVVVTALLVPTATGAGFGSLEQQSVDPDVVVMTADVAANGDAVWTVTHRVRLDNDNATQAFEDLQADIQTNRSEYTDRFGSRMQRTAGTAENATGREMTIENVTVTSREETFGQTYGVITYQFRWTNFAAVSDDRIEVGDALSGLFLDSETSLTVRWPAAYQAESVAPQADERGNSSVIWRGQQEFGANEPRVVVSSRESAGADGLLAGGLLALVGVVAAAYALQRYGLLGGGEPAAPPASMDESDDSQSGQPVSGVDDDAGEPPAELLSNEEQVLQLLESNGGRLKQQQVAGELDWTDAKTSQVIGGLRDADKVETFRIGRENVVTLPDTDVTGTNGDEDDGTGAGDKTS